MHVGSRDVRFAGEGGGGGGQPGHVFPLPPQLPSGLTSPSAKSVSARRVQIGIVRHREVVVSLPPSYLPTDRPTHHCTGGFVRSANLPHNIRKAEHTHSMATLSSYTFLPSCFFPVRCNRWTSYFKYPFYLLPSVLCLPFFKCFLFPFVS